MSSKHKKEHKEEKHDVSHTMHHHEQHTGIAEKAHAYEQHNKPAEPHGHEKSSGGDKTNYIALGTALVAAVAVGSMLFYENSSAYHQSDKYYQPWYQS